MVAAAGKWIATGGSLLAQVSAPPLPRNRLLPNQRPGPGPAEDTEGWEVA